MSSYNLNISDGTLETIIIAVALIIIIGFCYGLAGIVTLLRHELKARPHRRHSNLKLTKDTSNKENK